MSFAAGYSDEQREAIAAAYVPRRFTAQDVSRAAAAGELLDRSGQPVPAFEVPANTVRDVARKARRAGGVAAARTTLERGAGSDARGLLTRTVRLAERELQVLEEVERRGEPVSVTQLAKLARLVGELAKLEERLGRRPTPPSQEAPGEAPTAAVAGSVGPLLADHHSSATGGSYPLPSGDAPAPDATPAEVPDEPSADVSALGPVRALAQRLGHTLPADAAAGAANGAA